MGSRLPAILLLCGALVGCGTTKWTNTARSATEQLLISDAMDRAVSKLDFRSLAGRTVYLDSIPLTGVTDSAYLVSSLRQHMLASGCILKDDKSQADYIVEARSGAVGTDHHELIYGVPGVDIPAMIPVSGFGLPTQIPEIPFVKRTEERAVTKIAVFAYNRQTGRPVWQSGVVPMESNAKAIWVFGAGPFQRGSIYEGTNLAGDKLKIPLIDLDEQPDEIDPVSVADEAYFTEPKDGLAKKTEKSEPGNASKSSNGGKDGGPAGASPELIQTGLTGSPATQVAPPTPPPPAAASPTTQQPATPAPPPDPLPSGPPAPLPPGGGPAGEPEGPALPQ